MKARFYLVVSALIWGLNFHLLETMLLSVNFIEAGFWRYLFGVAALALYTGKLFPGWRLIKQNATGILLVGVPGLFCFNLFLVFGLQYTSSVNASLIISLNPVATLFLANYFFKSGITPKQLFGALLGVTGVVYLLLKGEILNLSQVALSKGDLFVLVAMFLSSFYHIWVKKYAAKLSYQHFTFLTNLVCFLSFLVVIPFFKTSCTLNYGAHFWGSALAFGVLGTAVTYIFWNKGLLIVGAGKAGIFMNIVPFATALIAIFLGKELFYYHYISGFVIILGLLISQMDKAD